MAETKKCIILGAGGHARVLIDSLLLNGEVEIAGILEPVVERWGQSLYDILILGGDDLLPEMAGRGVTHFVVGVGSTASNLHRKKLFEIAASHHLEPLTIIHPSAVVSRFARVGRGAQLNAGCIVNAGALVGENVILNSGVIIEHDCIIGDHVHVATGAKLSGTVIVGELAHIGTGASLRQSIHIGERAVVGAGAVVVKDVDPDSTVVGNPARPLTK